MKITTQIQGGLGNQLFQYATGKALNARLRGSLHLDIDWFNHGWEDVTLRHFLLPELALGYQVSTSITVTKPPKRWRRIAQELLPLNPYILNDRSFSYNSKLNQLKPHFNRDIYLMGYWQSFHYFESIRAELLNEIKPIAALSPHYQGYLGQIQNSLSGMVHVRRGDYVHLPIAAKVHGFLGLEYYQKGMRLLLEKNPKMQFFVFSDDIEWAKANLPYTEKICFIESSSEKTAPVQELLLMTKCQKHLIANSSLSWWGAWLSTGSDPHVIAPKNWTNNHDTNWDDLLPPRWQRL